MPFAQQYVILTKQEHIEIKSEASYWKTQHTRAIERIAALEKKLEEAEGKIRDLKHRLYGQKSEQGSQPRNNKQFVESASPDKKKRKRGQQTGSKGHGKTPRPDLPVDEIEVKIPQDEACCPTCHKPFVPFPGTEDSDSIEIEVRAHIRRIHRQRYKPSCHCLHLPSIITAPAPPRLLPRNTLGISVWSDVILDKYLYNRPTYRLLEYYKTLGLPISQGTITDGLKRLAPMFEPLVTAMYEKQMSESLFNGDETRWRVFEVVEGKIGYRWYLWVIISASVVYYLVAPGRGADVPMNHFSGLDSTIREVILVCDRYSAYKKLAREITIIKLAFCWSHVRRDFIDESRSYPEHKEWMFVWVVEIRQLYQINDQRVSVWDASKSLQEQSVDFNTHHQELQNALSCMAKRRDEVLSQANLPTPQKAVLSSLKNHWEGLTLFVDHPEIPMDNNSSERQLRQPANGRKNYYGSGSQWSAYLMAGLFTLLKTILLWKLDPRHWLTAFLTACAENGGKTPDDLTPFLPWSMSEERKQLLSQPLPPVQQINPSIEPANTS